MLKKLLVVVVFLMLTLPLSTAFATKSELQMCQSGTVTKSGSYYLFPNDPELGKIYYQVTYTINSNCTITGIKDRARVETEDGLPVKWHKSCVNASNSCKTWNTYLPQQDNWNGISWRVEPYSTSLNKQYRHYSKLDNGWTAYGYAYFTTYP